MAAGRDQLAHYRQVKTLLGGERVYVRPLTRDDTQGLLDLFARAPKQDLEYVRSDAGDGAVVESWVNNLDLRKVFPLVAIVDGRTVGDATLHFGEHYQRHRAWVRIYLDHDYRRRGIGTFMLRNLIKIARLAGRQQLYAEILTLQHSVIGAFEGLGFQYEVTLPDCFITDNGETLDMAILVLRLDGHTAGL